MGEEEMRVEEVQGQTGVDVEVKAETEVKAEAEAEAEAEAGSKGVSVEVEEVQEGEVAGGEGAMAVLSETVQLWLLTIPRNMLKVVSHMFLIGNLCALWIFLSILVYKVVPCLTEVYLWFLGITGGGILIGIVYFIWLSIFLTMLEKKKERMLRGRDESGESED